MNKHKSFLRKYAALVALNISSIVSAFAQGAVVAYVDHVWRDSTQYALTVFPTDEQLNRLTHVMPMVGVKPEGVLGYGDWNNNRKVWLDSLVNRAHRKGVQVIICLSDNNEKFASATNSTYFSTFVNNVVAFVNQFCLDGVDIDWEYPGKNKTNSQDKINEWNQCIALLCSLKNALPCKRISIALAGLPSNKNWYLTNLPIPPNPPIPKRVWEIVDAIHLMTYGNNDWTPHSNYDDARGVIRTWAEWRTSDGRDYGYLDIKKLHLGCAFYGKRTIINGIDTIKISDTYTTYSGVGYTGSRGDLPADIANKVNYCYGNNSANNIYGGVMIWELGYDIPDATNPNSLLKAAWDANTAKGGYPAIAITTQPASTTTVTHGSISGSLSVVTNKSCNYNGNTYDKAIYQWYENIKNSNVGGTPIQGATHESFSFPTSKTGTFYYYCVVKGKNSVTSNVATVKVTAGAFTIAGSTIACKNSVLTCAVTGLPNNITDNDVFWTCSSNLSLKGGNYGIMKQFDVTDAGNGWVKAKIIPLNNLILDKTVTLMRRPYYTVENLSVKSYTYYLYTPPSTPGVTNYHWVLNSPSLTLDNAYSLKLGVSTGMTGGTVVGYAISPACGESPTPDHVYILNVGKGTSSPSYIYPNPVGDILFIDVDALTQQFSSSSDAERQLPSFDIRLYDGQGNLLRQTTAKSGTIQFNVSKLPNGIYYLHIYDGVNETPEIQQIMVEH